MIDSHLCRERTTDEQPLQASVAAFHAQAGRHMQRKSTTKEHITKCAFCKQGHSSLNCQVVTDINKRYDIVQRDKLCYNCLGKHRSNDCRSKYRCKNCQRKHHTSLCKPAEEREKPTQNVTTPPSTEHAVFTNDVSKKCPVLLKTAIADISNGNSNFETTTILFDEGATRSFVTKSTSDKLQLKPVRSEVIHLSVFGDNSSQSHEFDVVNFQLKTTVGENVNISAVVVPMISIICHT